MTIRIGVIRRHEDVHGVSGTGVVAEVIEFSDGSAVARWLGKDAMSNVAAGVKNITNVHGHGGKMEIEWLWEQEPDADPMDAVFAKKIAEAGGSTGTAPSLGASGAAEKDAEAEAIAEELVEEAAELQERVAEKVAEKLGEALVEKTAEKVAEKTAEAAAEKTQVSAETAEE